MLGVRLFYYLNRLDTFAEKHRLFSAFFAILAIMVSVDILFAEYLYAPYLELAKIVPLGNTTLKAMIMELSLDSSAESWLALLSTVLGTLIIVISIASQSIPKLIDLYMQDRTSLLYVWLLIMSGAHAILIKMYGEIGLLRPESRVLNMHLLLPFCTVMAFPYIFYILKYTKPHNVINRISQGQLTHIRELAEHRLSVLMNIPSVVEENQHVLFESLNQLDDLLEYVSFKEPKADIIQDMNYSLQEYIRLKSRMNPNFFKVSPKIRTDISFRTLLGQFKEIERTNTFYEHKCFRLLGNVYIKLMEKGEFDLTSLCASQMTIVGATALEAGDNELLDLIIIRFNTYLRFAIKHGIKNNEGRNLYTTAFHYGNFIEHLVRHKKIEHVKRCFMYFRIYGTEIFKHGRNSPAMYFIVDVFAAEMKKSLMLVHEKDWDLELQRGLLKEFLMIDSPPDLNKDDQDRGQMINNNVRILQIGLALYYLRQGMIEFVKLIIKDVLDDVESLGEKTFRQVILNTSNRLRFSGPTFWEDTDRGNLNIYYTPDQNQIDRFNELLNDQLRLLLTKQVETLYKLTPSEAELLWDMSHQGEHKEISAVSKDPKAFERSLHELKDLDSSKVKALIHLRTKLNFTTDNPDLVPTTSRQIAVNSMLEVQFQASQTDSRIQQKARVIHNYPNYLYIKFVQPLPDPEEFINIPMMFKFRTFKRGVLYHFQSQLEDNPVDGMSKIPHSETIKIISTD
ncbi:hypothetical protein WDW89_16970 [Deltaproteobacteria bacterium TL4]